MKRPGPFAIVVGTTVLLVAALELGNFRAEHPLTVGSAAPEFALPRLDPPGDTLRLADLRGKVVLLEAWNTACDNCRSAMPAADLLADKYRSRGLVVIHVAWQNLADSVAMRRFLDETRVSGTVVVDDQRQFVSRYHMWAVPWSVLVDRQGRVAWQRPGVVEGAEHPLLTEAGDAVLQQVLAQ
jgi:peroxiredoxin